MSPIPAHPGFLHHPMDALTELVVDLCSSLIVPVPPTTDETRPDGNR